MKFKRISILILIILVLNIFFIIYPILKFRHDYCGPKELALFIKENTEPNAIIFTEIHNAHIDFYGDRKNEFFSGLTNFQNGWDNALNNNTAIYVSETFLKFQPNQPAAYIINRDYNLIMMGEVLTENFYAASTRSRIFVEKLYKVEKKN